MPTEAGEVAGSLEICSVGILLLAGSFTAWSLGIVEDGPKFPLRMAEDEARFPVGMTEDGPRVSVGMAVKVTVEVPKFPV